MSKCFITKLPSSVDNDNLPVLGQLRIKWLKQNNLKDNASRGFLLSTNNSITVKVSGAHFTDSTLTSNLGNTKIITAADRIVSLYVSNDTDAVLTIDNKYSLIDLNFVVSGGKEDVERSVYFDIEDIKYCTNLVNLYLNNTQISGDISALSNMVNLGNLVITNLFNGDMSKIPASTIFISQSGATSTTGFTWTAKGRQNANVLAIEGPIHFDTVSMDNMLIDQATCTLRAHSDRSWEKIISVSGTRTSASDAAVTTLQSKGVTITGVTKVS